MFLSISEKRVSFRILCAGPQPLPRLLASFRRELCSALGFGASNVEVIG